MLLTKTNLYALESFDNVCDKKGLQMATYLKKYEKIGRAYFKNWIRKSCACMQNCFNEMSFEEEKKGKT